MAIRVGVGESVPTEPLLDFATATAHDRSATLDYHRPARLSGVKQGWRQEDRWVTTRDGVRLAVRDCGSRHADHTVVFLHGLCLSQASWTHQVEHLLRRHTGAVRVISYDHRGHGRSGQAPMNSYHIEQLADDLAQVLISLGVSGSLTLAGHSMGGMTALCYLARPVAERPVDAHGLVLVATAAGRLSHRGLGKLLATPVTGLLYGLIDHTPAQAVRALTGPLRATLSRGDSRARAQRATLAAVTIAALASTPVPTAVGFLPSLRSYDQYHSLGLIRANTFVVSGGADPLTPPSHSRDLAAGIAGAAHVHLPTAGHMLPQQAPQVINAAIRRVMRQEIPPATANPASPTPAASRSRRARTAATMRARQNP
nr:alpha/beta fold hydrolase [Mycobacterium colombiense]